MANIEERLSKDGTKSYRVKIRLRGHPVTTATFARKTDAKKWVQDTEASIRAGRYFKTSQGRKFTLGEAIEKYIAQILVHKKKTVVNQLHYLDWWKTHLGEYRISDITPSMVNDVRNKLVGHVNKYGKKISPVTANRYVQCLSHVFTVASNEWEWVEANPVSKIKKFKEPRGRVRFLTKEERDSLLAACRSSENPHLYNIVIFALSTGARKSEILRLKWSDVDFSRERIIVQETKNDERRMLPLKGKLLAILKQSHDGRNSACEYVFPSSKTTFNPRSGLVTSKPIDIRTAWENALIRASVKDFRFHDLRHSAASYLAMNGASVNEIAEVLGQKTLQMVKRYAHFTESHVSNVVERMNLNTLGDENV